MEFTVEIFAFLIGVALVAGTIDAMAGGGGLLTIPALMAAGVPPVAALATNKFQSSFGTASAVITYWRGGHINLRSIAWPIAAAFLGSALGATVVQWVDSSFLALLVPVMLVAMALYFLFSPPLQQADHKALVGKWGLTAASFGLGFYDGFFGPGTGSFLTLAMVTLAGFGLMRAIASAKCLNFATNFAAVIAMVAGGHVLWTLGICMAVATIIGNVTGAKLAMRYNGKGVRPLLVIMSVGLTAKLLADPANPIWTLFG